tara:strand:+ start:2700 stop:3056 length:357 start_codon:yes stop_codon:yes gene_type:complete
MAISSSLRKAASSVLKAVGGDVTIRRVVPGTYNTTTGAIAETTTDTTVKGFVEDVNDREVNELIQSNDRRLTIAASSLTNVPTTTDRVVISSISYQIIRVKTEEQNNTAITHELILRA